MGAPTGNRKRSFDLSPLTSHSKKLKFSSPPRISDRSHPPPVKSASALCYPPPAPLRRPVHGPQRILRVFGLGSASSTGNFFSESFQRTKFDSNSSQIRAVRSDESLELEEYKRLVDDVREGRSVVSEIKTSVKETGVLVDLDGEVEDFLEVGLESVPVREESIRAWVREIPSYKELYENCLKKYDSKISSLGFEVECTEKKVVGFQLAHKAINKKAEEDLLEPFIPLTDENENNVYRALHRAKRCQVLATHEASNIQITKETLQCLKSGGWLNDDVINLYLALLKERERREPRRYLKCHFFNTFFYKKLTSGKAGYDFKAVRRWTTQKKIGYDIIECDKIFVPIHQKVHWCLAVINIKDKKFQYLDSLGGMDKMVLRVLARYLMDEAMDKSSQQIDTLSWKQETIRDLPKQNNGSDCGMFMLKYMDFHSRGLRLSFGQEHMAYFRKRTVKEILELRAE